MALSKVGGNQIDTVNGDLTVDTNTLHVDATNNNVGIGTTSPTNFANYTSLDIKGGTSGALFNLLDDDGTRTFTLNRNDSDVQMYNLSNTPMKFFTNNTERMAILAGGGITFNGDTAQANALDDYEESTYSFAERHGQATITTHRCRVVKIGALVYIDGSFTVGSTSNSNALNINLPFASTIGTNGLGGGSIGFSNLSTSIIEANLRPNIENLADNLFFRYGSNNLVTCTAASGKRIDFNVWYPVL
jgi:hypothetical protein